MANIQRGEASFATKDGTVYRLVMDFAAFAEAEDAAGMSVQELMKAVSPQVDPDTGAIVGQPRIKHLGALLYGALTAKHPNITPRDALNLFSEGEVVGNAIAKALEGAMPKADPSAEGKAPPRPRGTGTKRKPTGREKV